MNVAQAREVMVDTQIRPADVVNYKVLTAFMSTKREQFVPEAQKAQAYGEYEISLGDGRAMMTPRSLAKLIELASPKDTDEILLIGSGLGYEAAILAQLSATVIALETKAKLIKSSEAVLAKEGYDNAITLKGPLVKGDTSAGPYDLIIFNGAIEALPEKFVEQLKDEGRIVAIFHDQGVFTAKSIYKTAGRSYECDYFQASAPLLPGFEKKVEFSF